MTCCSTGHLTRHGGLADDQHEVQKRYFAERRLYTLQIESTLACPQDCVFCYAGASQTATAGLGTDEIRRLLDDATDLEIRAVDWLGGDPLVRPGWQELLRHGRDLGLINNVWSSGVPLQDERIAAEVVELTDRGFVSVHLDSVFPDTLRRLRRSRDDWYIDTIVAGVDNLLRLGKSPDRVMNCITFTAAQDPQDTIDTMRWWLERKGVRTCLTLFNPAGQGAELAELEPSPEAIQRVFSERDRINYGEAGGSIGAMDTDKFYCGTMATVTFTGDVTPCSVIRKGVGNVRRTPFKGIVAAHLDELIHGRLHQDEGLPAPCGLCAHNDHCWGCRATAFNYHGDADGPDPKCWIARAASATATAQR